MDFPKNDILSPNLLAISRLNAVDANDPYFDVDNDIHLSKNGLVIIPGKPIENYRWIELELQSLQAPVTNVVVKGYTDGDAPDFTFVNNAAANIISLAPFTTRIIRIPNINRIERIEIFGNFVATNQWAVVKAIRVVNQSDDFQLVHDSTGAFTHNFLAQGLTYDAVNDWYYIDLNAGGSVALQLNAIFARPADFVNIHCWVDPAGSLQSPNLPADKASVSMNAREWSFDLYGDVTKQTYPINPININNPGGGQSRYYIQLRYGAFPLVQTSAFGLPASSVIIPPSIAVPVSILGADNIWTGINTFQGQVNINAGLKFGAGTGFLKAVAGVVSAVAIGVADVAGLGTMAVQDAVNVAIAGGTINGTLIGNITPVAGVFTAVTANSGFVAGKTVGFTSNFNSGANTWQGYYQGTAESYFGGPVGIFYTTPLAGGAALAIGSGAGNHPSTTATIYGASVNLIAPNTAVIFNGYGSILQTAATAFTLSTLTHFSANQTIKGAGSSISNVRGFYAQNAIVISGSNNYGFYSDINSASNTYQLRMAGTADSQFDGPLKALGGFTFGASTGYLKATAGTVATVASIPSTDITGLGTMSTQNANAVAITGGSIAGTTFDNGAIGATTASTGKFTTLQTTGEAGIRIAPVTTSALKLDIPSTAGVSSDIITWSSTGPATLTNTLNGINSTLSSNASAYTITNIQHFLAAGTVKGAGSTITNVFGFYAKNAVAVGTNNYGYYSDINAATNTYQVFMNGSAPIYFNAPLAFFGGIAGNDSAVIHMGQSSNHPGTSTALQGYYVHLIAPSTATSEFVGFESNRLATAAVAFILNSLIHFRATNSSQGVGSTITSAYGFFANNGIAVATNNYGFYSNINTATTTWAFYGAGTAPSSFGGPVAIITTSGTTQALLTLALNNNHPSTLINIYSAYTQYNVPSTATSAAYGYWSRIDTVNSAFTISSIIHFEANTTVKGAASTITTVYGFRALTGIATGTNNYGYWSNIASATNTWQLRMSGTADSQFDGPLIVKSTVYTETTITYSASMTPDCSLGDSQIITVTNGIAFTINNPTNPRTGSRLRITFRNTSGGAMGAVTFGSAFKTAAFVAPATAFSRTYEWEYNGTNWIEHDRCAVDIPN